MITSPAVVNGVVYFGSIDGTFYAVKATTGAVKWSRFISARGITSSATVVSGVVYFAGGDHNVYALQAATGAVIWSYFTGAGEGVFNSSPAVVRGVVYILSSDFNLLALIAQTGSLIWSFATGVDRMTPRHRWSMGSSTWVHLTAMSMHSKPKPEQ